MAEKKYSSSLQPTQRGKGVLPKMAYTGRLRPKGVPFSGFRHIKGVGIPQVEAYGRAGKSFI